MSDAHASSSTGSVRCVLWRPKGAETPGALLRALERRQIGVTPAESSFAALAHLCADERTRDARPTPRAQASRAQVLLLESPESLEDVGAVLRTLSRYVPRTVCWVYESTDPPTLRAMDPRETLRWTAGASSASDEDGEAYADVPATPRPAPSLRLAGTDAEPEGPAAHAGPAPRVDVGLDMTPGETTETRPDRPMTPGEVLTSEELDMLLAEDECDERSSR